MKSVRRKSQKRDASETVDDVSAGGDEDHTVNTSKSKDAVDAKGLQSSEIASSSSSFKAPIGVAPKRPKLLRKITLGANGLDSSSNGSPVKNDIATNYLRASPRLKIPCIRVKPLELLMTFSLNKGESVNLREIQTALEEKERDMEIDDIPVIDIKVKPDIKEMITDDEETKCDKKPVNNIPANFNNEDGEHTNNGEKSNKKKRERPSEGPIFVGQDESRKSNVSNEDGENTIDDGKNNNKKMCGRPPKDTISFGQDVSRKSNRRRVVPHKHDDYVYDVPHMLTNKTKVDVQPKKDLESLTKGRKLACRPVLKTSKLRKIKTDQNNKKNVECAANTVEKKVKSTANDIQYSKNRKSNLHLKEVPVTPEDSGKETQLKSEMEFVEANDSIVNNIDDGTSSSDGEMEKHSPSSLKVKRGRPIGSTGKFVKDEKYYAVVNQCTQRGSKRLVCVDGYTYNKTKSASTGNEYWRCSHRPSKKPACTAVVKIVGTEYMKKNTHNHDPDTDSIAKCYVTSKLKKKCSTDFIERPQKLVNQILKDSEPLINQSRPLFKPSYLVRRFNRSRKSMKDKNPLIASIKVGGSEKPFLIEDVVFEKKRHMIFATKKQLQLLAKTDRWYIDITRKFECTPFMHLLSVSAYVQDDTKGDDRVKLKPLTFVLMSSLEKIDVLKVMRGLLKHLRKPILVRSLVLDFHEPLWKGIRQIFFNCKLFGCAWKFGEGIWRKFRQIGNTHDLVGLYDKLHKLLKLPFVQPKKIRTTYEILKGEDLADETFDDLTKYVESTWLNGEVWKISNWCVHGNPFRTKFDAIGWHYAVHVNANKNFLDMFLKELHVIAASITNRTRPAHQRTVQNYYKENESSPQGKMYKLWSQEPTLGELDFLSQCCKLSEPTVEGMVQKMNKEFR